MPGNGQNTFEIASYLISLHSPCGFGFIISTMENSSKRLSKMPTAGEQQSQYGELCLDNDIPTRNFREYESILFEDIFFLALLPKLKN